MAFAEIYGIPFRLGRYDSSATDSDKRALLHAIIQMGADAGGIIPRTTDIEFIDGKGGSSEGGLFKGLAEYIDHQYSKAALGQTATTDAVSTGLGGGLGNVHNDVRGDIERSDAKQLAATINLQIVQPMVMLNRGVRERYPRVVIGREDAVDLKATTEAIGFFVDRGLPVGMSHARKLTRTPEPKAGEALLTPARTTPAETPQEPAEGVGARPTPANTPKNPLAPLLRPLKPKSDGKPTLHAAGSGDDVDAIDLFIGSSVGAWEELVAPVVSPIEAMLAEATDLDDAKERLLGLIETDQADDLVQLLARGGFSARLAGLAGQPLDDRDE